MRYRINHQIKYAYSSQVFLEPHVFRMRPRCDASQQIRNFTMVISPEPAGRHDFLDPENNSTTCLWFDDQVDSLMVSTSFEVQTLYSNPFSYLVTDETFFDLPVHYADKDRIALAPYLTCIDQDVIVEEFAKKITDETNGKTIDFLSRLCTIIYETYAVEIRLEGLPYLPSETINFKQGACRDLAWLYIAVCRSVGLASRFVSGYQEGDLKMDNPYLHAWAEVYIPGGGWRGYDPTHGLAVSDRHVVLAASHDPKGASPVDGTFRGTDVTAEIEYHISLSLLSDQTDDK